MALYTADSKERVREAVDMVDLVGSRTELRRAGADSFVGLCPFHDERSPSFSVKPSDKLFYCFGCQASGDVFSFVMQAEGLDFKGALELLADRYSVELELEAEDPAAAAARQRRERLLGLLERTCAYYERVLWEAGEAAPARGYLLGRGLSEEMLREFRVGYASQDRDRVLAASRRGGYSERELWDVGLLQRGQAGTSDRFQARIMFPLCDVRGRVIGFGGRATREDQRGKYINTADTDLFHKGENVYGAHLARGEAARAASVVVCEGYTDVIAMHDAGVRSAVGLMGTALTERQVAQLGRLAPTVLLALDADGAGFKAMLKAAELAARRRLELRVVRLPAGSDPADIAAESGAERLRTLVAESVAFVRFRVERVLAAGELGSPEGRDRALGELRPMLAGLGQSAMRDELARLIAERLSLSEKLAASLLEAAPVSPGGGPSARDSLAPLDARARSERVFLSLCIALPDEGRRALAEIDVEALFTDTLTRQAADHLREHLDSPARRVDDDQLASLLAELAVRGAQNPAAPPQVAAARLQLELAHIDRQISGAGAGGRVSDLASQRRGVKERLEQALEQVLEESGAER